MLCARARADRGADSAVRCGEPSGQTELHCAGHKHEQCALAGAAGELEGFRPIRRLKPDIRPASASYGSAAMFSRTQSFADHQGRDRLREQREADGCGYGDRRQQHEAAAGCVTRRIGALLFVGGEDERCECGAHPHEHDVERARAKPNAAA